jgi:hypothetical protein
MGVLVLEGVPVPVSADFDVQVAANGLTSGTPRENTPLRKWIMELRAARELGSN